MDKMSEFGSFMDEYMSKRDGLTKKEISAASVGFLKGFEAGMSNNRECDGCIHEPERKGEDPFPEVCGTCQRFYGDMHSDFFME